VFPLEFVLIAIQHQGLDILMSTSTTSTTAAPESPAKKSNSTSLIRNLESRLEMLLLPTNDVDRTAHIISQFEQDVSSASDCVCGFAFMTHCCCCCC
jgi:hypothetical protein